MKKWEPSIYSVPHRRWTKEEEEDALNLSMEDFLLKYPYRTKASRASKIKALRKEKK